MVDGGSWCWKRLSFGYFVLFCLFCFIALFCLCCIVLYCFFFLFLFLFFLSSPSFLNPSPPLGTNVPFIMEERGITAEPIEISRLLEEDPATREQKEKGWMVNDNTVLNLLLRRLLDDDYSNGAVVDGFPRTEVQVQFIKFLHDKMLELRKHFSASPERHFRRPQFRVCVLFVGEKTSIDRQLERGRRTKEYNEKLASGGFFFCLFFFFFFLSSFLPSPLSSFPSLTLPPSSSRYRRNVLQPRRRKSHRF